MLTQEEPLTVPEKVLVTQLFVVGDAVTSITDVGAACEAGRLIVEGVGGAYRTSVSNDVDIYASVAAVGVWCADIGVEKGVEMALGVLTVVLTGVARPLVRAEDGVSNFLPCRPL